MRQRFPLRHRNLPGSCEAFPPNEKKLSTGSAHSRASSRRKSFRSCEPGLPARECRGSRLEPGFEPRRRKGRQGSQRGSSSSRSLRALRVFAVKELLLVVLDVARFAVAVFVLEQVFRNLRAERERLDVLALVVVRGEGEQGLLLRLDFENLA